MTDFPTEPVSDGSRFNPPMWGTEQRLIKWIKTKWLQHLPKYLIQPLCLFSFGIGGIWLTGCEPIPTPSQVNGANSVGGNRLDMVLRRGKLICGVSGELPGFSFVNKEGKYSGIDVDVCRAVAAALFNNPDAVQYRNLNAKERFTALQAGEVDLLSRNTTWTLSRDTASRLAFLPVVFYDGQGLMVRKADNIKNLPDLKDAAICAQTGTTTEQNLSEQMRRAQIPYQAVVFEDVNATFAAYESGRCKAVTADRSALVTRRTRLAQPDDHLVLDVSLSKEPLAPAVLDGDSRWGDAVRWIIYATVEAEDLGITSQNLTQQQSTGGAVVRRFLGMDGSLGKDMGLPNDFAARVVRHVGNYGEIYERNLGEGSAFRLPRAQNRLWRDGGLMYAPPFR